MLEMFYIRKYECKINKHIIPELNYHLARSILEQKHSLSSIEETRSNIESVHLLLGQWCPT
jgi:hypothetical protein